MGDVILSINGEKTETFADIVRLIVPEAKEEVTLEIEREGQILTKKLRPKLDPKTGAGIIGFYSFIPLEIDSVKPSSSAELAGLKKGDLIMEVNGIEVANTVDLNRALGGINEKTAELGILRDENKITKTVNLIRTENGIDLGLNIKSIKVETPGTGFFKSIVNGFVLTHKAFVLTFKSLGLLFKGVDFRQAVSGPVRITHMLGDVAAQGFKAGFLIGLSDILNFVSIISISLFIMNLLPIPILDGGLILFAFIEFIFRRQIHPKVLYYVQFIGIAFIGIVFIFALWGDIGYFLGR